MDYKSGDIQLWQILKDPDMNRLQQQQWRLIARQWTWRICGIFCV